MKHLFLYIATTLMLLGSIRLNAQTDCPNIEWMRFFNDSANYSCNIFNIDSDKNSLVVGYYEGSPSWGSFNFPTATNLMTNYFISKADSIGSPLWLHVAKSFTYGGGSAIGRPITSFNNDIYTVVNFKWKTEFAGTTYMANAQKANSLLVKMNQQGGIIATHLFDSTSFALIHMDDSLNYYCFTGFSGTYYIDNHIFNSIGGIDYLVFKLNSQFQLQWAQQIGGAQTESIEAIIADSQNNIYIAGRFNSPTLTLGNTQLTNPYSSTSTNDIYTNWANKLHGKRFSIYFVVTFLHRQKSNPKNGRKRIAPLVFGSPRTPQFKPCRLQKIGLSSQISSCQINI